MSKIETIELYIKDEKEDGVFAISLVGSPAIEENFVVLSKHEKQIEFKAIDDERKILVGFALVPDKEIYRKQKVNGVEREFNVTMSAQTVAKASELYMKNLNNNNTTTEHAKPIQGATVIESWIVEDPKNDKSNLYNLNAKGGEWVIMMKMYNNEEYQKAKNGEYNGFSIEAMFQGFEQLNSKELTIEEQIVNELNRLISENATT